MKTKLTESETGARNVLWIIFRDALLIFIFLVIALIIVLLIFTPAGNWLTSSLDWLFAADSVQLWWFVTRSAGIMAYLLLWLSTVWGLAVPSKIVSPVLEAGYTFDFHQFISLLSIAFLLVHILVLALDRYLPYSAPQILIPFLSPYRPFWVGIGVISFYLILLVTITFYIRTKIKQSVFRAIHLLSLVAYLGGTLHGLYSGTDSPLLSFQLMYKGTGLVVVFLTVYWLVLRIQASRSAQQKALATVPAKSLPQPNQRKLR